MFKTIAINALVAAALLGGGLYAYHRSMIAPAQRLGVVDVAEIWRVKEKQFADALGGGAKDAEQTTAMEIARSFAERLSPALEELAGECGCLVLARSAVVVQGSNVVDLTPALKRKLEGSP